MYQKNNVAGFQVDIIGGYFPHKMSGRHELLRMLKEVIPKLGFHVHSQLAALNFVCPLEQKKVIMVATSYERLKLDPNATSYKDFKRAAKRVFRGLGAESKEYKISIADCFVSSAMTFAAQQPDLLRKAIWDSDEKELFVASPAWHKKTLDGEVDELYRFRLSDPHLVTSEIELDLVELELATIPEADFLFALHIL